MIRRLSPLSLFLFFALIVPIRSFAQTCSGTLSNGQNIVTNGGFAQGYTGWTHDAIYSEFTPCNGCYSVPGKIYAGTDPRNFNPGGFTSSLKDHSGTSDNNFLMIDGICQRDITLWQQDNIPITPNTAYFFTVWYANLKYPQDNYGLLQFKIDGTLVGNQIDVSNANGAGVWKKYTFIWTSPANADPFISISIQNLTDQGCGSGVDFAIDDISFSPGCEFGGPGPLPNLGDDFTICGKTTPFNINPNFDAATIARSDVHYKWYKDGVLIPGENSYNLSVSAPGTYSICVDSAAACPKSDILVISNTYSIALGPDFTLCNSNPATLDAGFSGPGVTYQWYKNSALINGATDKTYSVSNAGTYSVTVVDPVCGTQSDEIIVTKYDFDLGLDFTLCNPNSATLTVGYTGAGVTYQWYNNSQAIGGATNNTYIVNSAGTYSVTVNDPVCLAKTDQVKVTTNAIELGPNVTLCKPTTATLDAGFTRAGVTYQWYKNSTLIDGATNKTYSVTNPATYSVTVIDPVCGAQTDDITITTDAATPKDSTFCPTARGGKGTTTLKVEGTGKYKWWTQPTGGSVVATGDTYVTPVLTAPGPYTYYVEDTSTFALTLGNPAVGNGYSNPQGTGYNDSKNVLVFNALTSFKLDTITVLPYNYYCPTPGTGGNANIVNIIIYDANNVVVGQSNYTGQCMGQGQPAAAMKVPVGISIPQGNGYKMRLANGSTQIALYLDPGTFTYPKSFSSVIEFTDNSSDFNSNYKPNAFPGYFDWKITKGINCDRVPVTASLNCPDCVEATPATSASVDVDKICASTPPTQLTFTAVGGSGEDLVLYKGSCDGTEVKRVPGGGDIVLTGADIPTSTTTYFIRWESPSVSCKSKCVNVTVTVVPKPTDPTATDKSLCNSTSVKLDGNAALIGVGEWSIVSGTGTITDKNNSETTVTDIGVGDLVLEWTINNDICLGVPKQIVIHRVEAKDPTSLSVDVDKFCEDTPPAQITLTAVGGSGTDLVLYTGTCGGTELRRVTTDGDIILTGADIPTETTTYFVRWETEDCKSECKSVTVNVVKFPDAANVGPDQGICADSAQLAANTPVNGIGKWTLGAAGGTGVIVDDTDPYTKVKDLSLGDIILIWTISNEPCLATDDQVDSVIIHRDELVKPEITGLSFDTCAALTGLTYSTVTDHSPAATYTWTSTMNSLTLTPVAGTNTVTVDIGTSIDTLIVVETLGACSLKDSAIITLKPNISAAYAGLDRTPCVNSIVLNATTPLVGTGKWTTTGTATFVDATDPHTTVSGLSSGANTLTWTVEGCGGPLSDEVIITVGGTAINLDVTGPVDTMCVDFERSINLEVSGGSGNYRYLWASSDSSLNRITSDTAIEVTPGKPKVTYYVFAVDMLNSGCASDVDSVVIHTIDSQVLWFNTLITANDDGLNEALIIRDPVNLKAALPGTSLDVYNRWGSRVYQSNDYKNDWKPTGIADGVYYFKLKAGCGGKEYNGWFQLIKGK